MYVLNFSHPLTQEQQKQIQHLTGKEITEIKTIPVQINQEDALEAQVATIVDSVTLTSEEWQTQQLLINPPGYAPAAFVLLAMLHARIGHFPALIRIRPLQDPITSFEVAEILNLQSIRDRTRLKR